MTSNHALVVGASGLIGWAVVDQLLRYCPSATSSAFSKITALVNRPIKLQDTFWPEPGTKVPKLALVTGINLSCSDDNFEELLRDKLPDASTITHVFYCGMSFKEVPANHEEEVTTNVGMMRRLVMAVKSLSPNFSFLVYPGGTRGYGIYRPEGVFAAPLVESMADELPEDYSKTVAYPHYRTMLSEQSKGEKWTWCELCPDVIVGFTPNGSGFSLAGHWATFLYTWKLVHGEGSEVPYPGVKESYDSLFTESSATVLARVGIYAALHPETFRESIFNVADDGTAGSMRERWPQICSWFGLKGAPPPDTADAAGLKPGIFIKEHQDKLKKADVYAIDIWNAAQLDSYGYWLTFDRQLSVERLRKAGFNEVRRPEVGWWEAFDMFKKAGMIR
ncbi:hypothetical protein BS50DRAFT_499514 [Corynespora cassiicola Philippines]|uniref:PRISE-like Rossmann-fold domain-containing protein n=1 Tax=Corynespora cassiicola Philippines TaxID=1448308 RepID=A0A2T2NDX5_CORCC|nr:hypothetical protein BS50DRAFT_499514 [Corynespora cassiicola Philippines]